MAVPFLPGSFADTALALEQDSQDPWFCTQVAGLQFYDYGEHDELVGHVLPQLGDALTLVRRPDNQADQHAVEVWWRNRFMLGHLPRGVAAQVAPLMDQGRSLRGYCWSSGTGRAWSMELIAIGEAAAPLHEQAIERMAWRESEKVWSGGGPTKAKRREAEQFEESKEAMRLRRRGQAVYAFHLLDGDPPPPLPDGADAPPNEEERGKTYTWWDQVPAWLMTKTTLGIHGLALAKGQRRFARIEYGRGSRSRCYDLYVVSEARPKRRVPNEARARAAEGQFIGTFRPMVIERHYDDDDEYWDDRGDLPF